jgi:hypothetical protein
MRVAFLTLLLLFGFTLCVAQENTVSSYSTSITLPGNQSQSSEAAIPPANSFAVRNLAVPPRDVRSEKGAGQLNNVGTCFTMRSYLFSPSKLGQAPKAVGYTTCTPSNALQMKQARRSRAKVLPQ